MVEPTTNDRVCLSHNAGNITESHTEIADLLINHFATIGPNLAAKIPKSGPGNPFLNIRGGTLDKKQSTTRANVEKMIKELPTHKSMGLQNFSTKLVRDAAPDISEILAHILNNCIITSSIPFEWKTARITPLYNLYFCSVPMALFHGTKKTETH